MKAETLRLTLPHTHCQNSGCSELPAYQFLHHRSPDGTKAIGLAGLYKIRPDKLERGHTILRRAFMNFVEDPSYTAKLAKHVLTELRNDRNMGGGAILNNLGTVEGAIEMGVVRLRPERKKQPTVHTIGEIHGQLYGSGNRFLTKARNPNWKELGSNGLYEVAVPSYTTLKRTIWPDRGESTPASVLFYSSGLRHPDYDHPFLEKLQPDGLVSSLKHPPEQAGMIVRLGH